MTKLDKRVLSPEALAKIQSREKDRANRFLLLLVLALLTVLLSSWISWAFEADRLKARINVLENTKVLK